MAFAPTRTRQRPRRPRRIPKAPRWLLPRGLERSYAGFLNREVGVRLQGLIRAIVIPALPRIHAQATHLRPDSLEARVDQWPDEIDRLIQSMQLGMNVKDPGLGIAARQIALDLSKQNRDQFSKILNATIGTDIFTSEPWLGDQMQSFVKRNVKLVETLKTKSISDLDGILQRGLQGGLRVSEIEKEVRGLVGKTKANAKLIARDQIAKANSDIAQLRQEEIGVTKYVWRTSQDSRVRTSHSVMNGKTCIWSDPTVYLNEDGKKRKRSSIGGVKLHPGKDYQCRCTAEPVMDDLLGL